MRTTFLSAALLLIAFIGIGTDSAYAAKRNSNNATTKAKEQALQTITMDAAKAHIGFLASDELRGRKAGTNDAQVAAQYIISLLRQWGIKPLGDSYTQPFSAYSMEWQKRKPWQVHPDSIALLKQMPHRRLNMKNVLAMIPGKNTNEYVIMGAHFDHVGCDPDLEGDSIYNGADDNATSSSSFGTARRSVSSDRASSCRHVPLPTR